MKYFLFILILLFSDQSLAGVYKCVDANGNKIYSSAPCARWAKQT